MGRRRGFPRAHRGVPPPYSFFAPRASFPPPSVFFSRPFSFGAGTAFDFAGGFLVRREGCLRRRTTKRKRQGCRTRRLVLLETLPLWGGGGALPFFLGGGLRLGGRGGGACPLFFFLRLPSLLTSHPPQKCRILTPQPPYLPEVCPRSGLVGPRGAPQLRALAAVLPVLQAAEHG